MEENNRNKKANQTPKGKKILAAVMSAVLVCVAIICVFWGQKDDVDTNVDAPVVQEEAQKMTASDEETLRKLLKEDSNLEICVDKDMEITKGFEVNGTKKLTGNAELKMALDAEFEQGLLMVTEGTSLVMDGLVLNGNYVADGIQMEPNATLEYLSGTIKLTDAFGIQANGKVTIKDVSIDEALHTGISAESGCELLMEGGTIKNSASYDMWVCKEAIVEITDNAVFEGNYGSDVIRSYGTLNVTGGTFSAGQNTYIFRNHNKLNIAGKDGEYVECFNSGYAVVCNRDGGETNISRLWVHDTSRHAVVMVNGKTTIKDSKFETTGTHAIEAQGGDLVVENVTVKNSGNSGLEARAGATVSIKDFSVDGCKGIGIASRGANITGENIKLTNIGRYGVTCGKLEKSEGFLTLKNTEITKAEKASVYAYENGTVELVDVKISNGNARGIYTYKQGSVTMSGNSIIENMKNGGVRTDGKFVLNSGEIRDNDTEQSGAGVYIGKNGSFVMNGGSIYNNDGGLRGGGICVTEGTVTINDGKIYKNTCADNGGGIYAQKTSVVNLVKGSITENKSAKEGDGICIVSKETKVTMQSGFYLGKNDVKVNNVEAVFRIEGNTLSKHSAADPLLLTPNHDAKVGTVVATCKNANIANSIAAAVGAGDGSYKIIQKDKNFTIDYTVADMDMTGADTKFVSSFEELKEAILGTTGKRNIVLTSNIVMKDRIRLNGGSTIRIKDDGNQRTITREKDYTGNFFVTHYGTGLYLEATKQGNLVLDGTYASTANVEKVNSLVRTSGSTIVRNVAFQNNGSLHKDTQTRGAFVRQLYGDSAIYDSTFNGGLCRTGGAVMIDAGKGYIQGSTFTNNQSIIGGGAVRANADTKLEIVDSVFTENKAGTSGGVLAAVEKANVTIKDTKFVNNEANSYGGALYIQDESTTVTVTGSTFEANKSKGGGAIYLTAKADLTTKDSKFVSNTTKQGDAYYNGGAIETRGTYVDENSSFDGNVGKTGGAVAVMLGKATFTGKDANAVFFANEVQGEKFSKGGAIYVDQGSAVIKNYTFTGNKALIESDSMGGALCANKDATIDVEKCTFEANESKKGGSAIMVSGGAKVTSKESIFKNNVATAEAGNGGAVRSDGTYEDTNSTFENNSGRNGGAIAVMAGKAALTKTEENTTAKFSNNTAAKNGNAIFVQNAGASLEVTGYLFEGNVSSTSGVAIYVEGPNTTQGLEGGNATLAGTTYQKLNADNESEKKQTVQCKGTLVSDDFEAKVGTTYYTTFERGLSAVTDGKTVYVLKDVEIEAQQQIKKNVVITNAPGKNVAIKLNKDFTTSYMFAINADYSLVVGTDNAEETGTIVIDGNGKKGRAINNSGTFILQKNATISNMQYSDWGVAIMNRNTAYVYGSIKDCTLALGTVTKGGIILNAGGSVLLEIDGKEFTNNKVTQTDKAAVGGFIMAQPAMGTGNTSNQTADINIKGGTFTGNTVDGNGAVLSANPAEAITVTITGGTFSNNSATGNGGVISIGNSQVTVNISGSSFSGNSAVSGGAIYSLGVLNVNTDQTGETVDVIFSENEAKATGGGGAIFVSGSSVSNIKYTKFEENFATGSAGGMLSINETGIVRYYNCIIKGNYTTATQNGGAIYAKGTDSNKKAYFYGKDCQFEGNTSSSNGGAIILQAYSEAVLEGTAADAKFTANTCAANKKGSAIFVNNTAFLYIKGYTFVNGSGTTQSINLASASAKCFYYNLTGTLDTDYSFTTTPSSASNNDWTMPSWVNAN